MLVSTIVVINHRTIVHINWDSIIIIGYLPTDGVD